MTDDDHDDDIGDFASTLLDAIAKGPIGAHLLALAKGESRLVVRRLYDAKRAEAWTLEVEPIEQAVVGSGDGHPTEEHPS